MTKNMVVAVFLVLLSVPSFAEGTGMPPSESICLEPAVNEFIAASEADVHLVRDSKTGLIAKIIDLDSGDSYYLAYLNRIDGVEFLSFEGNVNLLNIWARVDDDCKVAEVRLDPIAD